MTTLLTNERDLVGGLLLGAPMRPLDDIAEPRLRDTALVVVCARLLEVEVTDERIARCLRAMGHDGPIERELEELRREASLHQHGGLG